MMRIWIAVTGMLFVVAGSMAGISADNPWPAVVGGAVLVLAAVLWRKDADD